MISKVNLDVSNFYEVVLSKWESRNRPERLEKRFEFENYDKTRTFLDDLGEHSEHIGRFPDISFGKTYVNITIRPENNSQETSLTEVDHKFAGEIDELYKN